MNVKETREAEEDTCLRLPQTPPPPPSIGAMSAFIDFVKPFSMLLPMCLQDSKSRSIPGGGLWGEIRQKHPTCSGRKTALTDPETTFQLSALLPALHTTHTHTHIFLHRELMGMTPWGPLFSLTRAKSVI